MRIRKRIVLKIQKQWERRIKIMETKAINASARGGNAKEKIMNSMLDAVWDEIPIEIDEMITEEELFQ